MGLAWKPVSRSVLSFVSGLPVCLSLMCMQSCAPSFSLPLSLSRARSLSLSLSHTHARVCVACCVSVPECVGVCQMCVSVVGCLRRDHEWTCVCCVACVFRSHPISRWGYRSIGTPRQRIRLLSTSHRARNAATPAAVSILFVCWLVCVDWNVASRVRTMSNRTDCANAPTEGWHTGGLIHIHNMAWHGMAW